MDSWTQGGQGANEKAAEEGVRFGQTIWLSWVLAILATRPALGHSSLRDTRVGRLGGGYPDVSAAVPRAPDEACVSDKALKRRL
jgi:hypothetical protein